MKKTYKTPITLYAELDNTEYLNTTSPLGKKGRAYDGAEGLGKERDDDWDDEEDLW